MKKILRCIALATLLLAPLAGAQAQITPPPPQSRAEIIVPPAPSGIMSNRANVNNVRIHYLRAGSGPAIVLLHGWASTSSMWRNVIPELAKKFTVIAPDMRGYGGSSHVLEWFGTKEVGEDIRLLMEQQGFKQFSVVGFDLGVHVTFQMATAYPDIVQKIVILDSVVPGIAPWEALTRDPRLWHWSFYSVPDLPESLIEGKENLYFSWFLKSFAMNHVAVDAEIPRVVSEFTAPGGVRAALQLFRARNATAQQNTEWVKSNRIKMPVLALGGEGGTGSTLFDQLSTVGDNVEGGVIRNCGHWIIIECPEVFTARAVPFLEGRKSTQ